MDETYMRRALELAEKGAGRVNPNPVVGAVIVKNGKIIGEGYHQFYGGPHAEINAFHNAVEEVRDSTLYVTLEPCCHFGKTPPCVDEIIRRGIKRVVVGVLDPNPLVAGQGVKRLQDHGIETNTGVMEEECRKINEVFMRYVVSKKPFVIMKSAMTLDGKIASHTGNSKWITGEEARKEVHKLRNRVSAIMVGIGTVLTDDPELTCRIEGGRNPKRIVVDSSLQIPFEAAVVKNCDETPVYIATTKKADMGKIKALEAKGIHVLVIPEFNGRVDLKVLLIKLGEVNIDSVLLEGGAALNYSAMAQSIVDKVQFYIAPKIIGGELAKTPLGGIGIPLMKDAFPIEKMTVRTVGEDVLLEGYVGRRE